MKLTSHGTAGARRRLRLHCEAHAPLLFAGRLVDGDLAFELHVTGGRTYTLRLDDADVAEIAEAGGWVRTVRPVVGAATSPQAELRL